MRAVILAAGRGRRLGRHTADRPKCLVELRGRTLLDRQVSALRAAGAREVAVVAGWHAELFGSTGLTVFINDGWSRTTMVESLAAADSWLREDAALVSYGDIVYSAATVGALAAAEQDLAIAYDPAWQPMWERRFAAPLEDAETFRLDRRGLLAEIGGRPTSAAQVQGQYLGLLKFTPAAWQQVSRILRTDVVPGSLDMTGLLGHLLREHGFAIGAVPVSDPWWEFDHPGDLHAGLDVLDKLDPAA